MPFPWCVAWACACGPDMQVGAEALHDAWAYMLGELGNAAIEVAVCTPADLRCTFPVRPVLHQAFGVSGMTLCTTGVDHVSAGLHVSSRGIGCRSGCVTGGRPNSRYSQPSFGSGGFRTAGSKMSGWKLYVTSCPSPSASTSTR